MSSSSSWCAPSLCARQPYVPRLQPDVPRLQPDVPRLQPDVPRLQPYVPGACLLRACQPALRQCGARARRARTAARLPALLPARKATEACQAGLAAWCVPQGPEAPKTRSLQPAARSLQPATRDLRPATCGLLRLHAHTLTSRASPACLTPELCRACPRFARLPHTRAVPGLPAYPPASHHHARRADVLGAWKCDAAAQRAFKSREKALRAFFAAMCAKGAGPSSRSVRLDVLLRELQTRKVGT
jgi:hypothetical protein